MPINNKLVTLGDRQQLELYRQINKEYRKATKELEKELEIVYSKAKYDDKGKLKTPKSKFKDNVKKITGLVATLWALNGIKIEKTSVLLTSETLLIYEFIGFKNYDFTPFNIKKIVKKAINDRNKAINFAKTIKSNSKRLNKRLNKQIIKSVVKGESERVASRRIKKIMKNNSGMARTVARTETNYYRSESQLIGAQETQARGVEMSKEWIYSYRSKERRNSHENASGQVVPLDSNFVVGGLETPSPQHFGIAREDINCNCRIRTIHADLKDDSLEGLSAYRKEREEVED